MPEQIVIVEYDPNWLKLFKKLQTPVAEVLGESALAIEHVGSTIRAWTCCQANH